jgi:hypothetical protein
LEEADRAAVVLAAVEEEAAAAAVVDAEAAGAAEIRITGAVLITANSRASATAGVNSPPTPDPYSSPCKTRL